MKAFYSSFVSLLLAACCYGGNPLAADFAGADDYIDILNSVVSDPVFSVLGTNITVACWFNADTLNGTQGQFHPAKTLIELRGEGTSAHVPFSLGTSQTDKIFLGVTDDYINNEDQILGATTIVTGQLYHVCITISGNDYVIYLDGVSDASGTFANSTGDRTTGAQTANLQLGIRSKDSGVKDANEWDGNIEDLIIWDFALSAGQAKTLHTTKHASIPYPVLWRGGNPNATATGDSATGLTFPDRSPNNKNGTGVSAITLVGSHVKKRRRKAM